MTWAVREKSYSQRRACRLVGLHPKTYRYAPKRSGDEELRKRLRELASQRRRFGYRRLGLMLKRQGIKLNRKKLYRLYKEERLRDCQYFCVRPVIHHEFTKRSLNMTANCVFASAHSRGGRFHSAAAWFKTKYSSFVAASSEGKCPLVLTARRSWGLKRLDGICGVDNSSNT